MLDKVQFCEIGMPRTATRSLAKAMKDLRFIVSHGIGFFKGKEDIRDKYLHDLLYGTIPKHPYENYEFVGNFPYMHWKKLAETKPDLKFILTIRDEDSWWSSCETRWARVRNHRVKRVLRRNSIIQREIPIMIASFHTFGCYGMDEFCWRNGFRMHNHEVLEYFKDSDRLLIHNVFEGDGWEKLCSFVGKNVPNEEYPSTKKLNITSKI